MSAIDGKTGLFGCDMIQVLFNGDVHGEYYMGWRDVVLSKTAYILTLVTSGITV